MSQDKIDSQCALFKDIEVKKNNIKIDNRSFHCVACFFFSFNDCNLSF